MVEVRARPHEAGRAQARATARLFANLTIAAIHCSTLTRAVETAGIIAEGLPHLTPRKTDALVEGIPTVPPSQRHLFQDFMADVDADHVPACKARLDRAFDRFFRPLRSGDRHELIVCHGNAIRYLLCRTLCIDTHCWTHFHIGNCGVTRVALGNRFGAGAIGARLETYNETGHIPLRIRTA